MFIFSPPGSGIHGIAGMVTLIRYEPVLSSVSEELRSMFMNSAFPNSRSPGMFSVNILCGVYVDSVDITTLTGAACLPSVCRW